MIKWVSTILIEVKRNQLIKELAEFMMIVKKVVITKISIKEYRYHKNLVGTGLPGFAYIYDTTAQPGIPDNGSVTFNTNGNITPAGFVTHVPGTAPIIINQTGIYPTRCLLQVALMHLLFSMATTK